MSGLLRQILRLEKSCILKTEAASSSKTSLFTSMYGVTSQKNWIFINTDVRNSDFALPRIFSCADVNNGDFILKYTTESLGLQKWYRLFCGLICHGHFVLRKNLRSESNYWNMKAIHSKKLLSVLYPTNMVVRLREVWIFKTRFPFEQDYEYNQEEHRISSRSERKRQSKNYFNPVTVL
jgi:hypothetical protein